MSTNASISVLNSHNSEGILCNAQAVEGTRNPDDIIRMARPATKKLERQLLDCSQLIHFHPEALPQIAVYVRSRLSEGNRGASVREAFEKVRWNAHVHMANELLPLMARVLLYVHPDLTGMVQLIPLPLDETLGMRVSDKKLPGDYAQRLEWSDGRPLTEAPAHLLRKPMQSVRPAQGELFEVA